MVFWGETLQLNLEKGGELIRRRGDSVCQSEAEGVQSSSRAELHPLFQGARAPLEHGGKSSECLGKGLADLCCAEPCLGGRGRLDWKALGCGDCASH